MLIGNRYSDNKLYRGIKHYDKLPLTSGDLHEYADILQMKNAYLLNNLLGSGTLNDPEISISSTGISLLSPSILLIDGDISLVQSSNTDILTTSEIANSGITEGLVCIVGWYQSLTANSTLREYGGVRNSVLTNDILDTKLNVQVSTRYQLRWDIVILDRANYSSKSTISFNLLNRDETGNTTTGSTQITTKSKLGDISIANKPTNMTYAVSDLYIVPILQYTYSNNIISSAKAVKPLKTEGSAGTIIQQSTEPTGEIEEGTIWYNTNNQKFKIYVQNVGFIATSSDLNLIQYRNTITIDTDRTTATNVRTSIGIEQYTEDDILQVLYNGVVLTESIHYTLHPANKAITLVGFTTRVGDQITFIVTKLVDAADVDKITGEFTTHTNSIGNNTTSGHVKLSDTFSSSMNSSNGVAATPKSVYDATTITDSVTNKKYRLSITNGVLGIVEVS